MKEFNFWCKENTDHGECADKVCDYDNCCWSKSALENFASELHEKILAFENI